MTFLRPVSVPALTFVSGWVERRTNVRADKDTSKSYDSSEVYEFDVRH